MRRVLEQVLRNHEPFPAWAVAPGLRFIGSNRAAERLMPGMTELSPEQLVDLWCGPQPGMSEAQATQRVIGVLRHELHAHPHPAIGPLLQRAEARAQQHEASPEPQMAPVMCQSMFFEGREIKTVATVLRFDKPVDVTMAELRVELVFPADAESEALLRELAGASRG